MNYIELYPGSVLIYLLVLAISYVLAVIGNKTNDKKMVYLIIIILSLFAGLRHEFVGTDTRACLETMGSSVLFDNALSTREFGYRLVNIILFWVFNSSRMVLVFYSFVIVSLFIIRLWELRETINFPFSVVIFFALVYLQSFNTLRQMIAVSIIFYGIKYLDQKKNVRFFICVIVATLFHLSAPISLFIFIIYDFFNLNFRRIQIKKLFLYCMLIGVAFVVLSIGRTQFLIESYFISGTRITGHASFFTISIVAFLYILERIPTIAQSSNYFRSHAKNKLFYNSNSTLYLVGLLISTLLSGLMNASRVSYYFTCLSIIFYSYKFNSKTIRIIKVLFCLMLVARDLYSIFRHSGMGIMPYRFFWE